ncbi:MAG: tetratricopeptide repeat protein [Myxococcales bacterium]|nr:tetratricopeptide repeat protein [Myxococcales bacterium]
MRWGDARLLYSSALCVVACGAPERTDARSPVERGVSLRDEGRLIEAAATLEPAAAAGDRTAILALAETHILRGHHAAAVALLEPRLQQDAADADAAGLHAKALDGAGKPDLAVRAYARRLALVPRDAVAAARLAALLVQQREYVRAGQVAEAGLALHPADPALQIQAARALLGRGRLPQALDAARRSTELAPLLPEAWLILADVHLVAGEAAKAEAALTRCLELDPQHADALRKLGTLLVETGEAKRAATVLLRAVRVAPASAPAWNALAAARHKEQDFDGALQALDQAVAAAPDEPGLHRNRAEIALDAGRPDVALMGALAAREALRKRRAGDDELATADDLVLRSIVVGRLADHHCRHDRDAAALQRAVDRELQVHGLAASPEQQARAGEAGLAHARAATAYCPQPAKAAP